MDSVTAQVIIEGFQKIENAMIALKGELRNPKGSSIHDTMVKQTDYTFEELRAYMHDGPELDDDGTV